MILDNAFAKRQADARAVVLCGVERIEDFLNLFRRDSFSLVVDFHFKVDCANPARLSPAPCHWA